MVLAIASVLLVALLMGVIFSSVMFSVGNTTATRAHAASRAAAEGRAQQVGRKLLQNSVDATISCSGLTVPNDAWVKYEVDGVWFKEKESDTNWKRCDNGGPGIPKLAHAVRVKTTGYSDSAGTDPGPGGTGDKGSVGQQGNKRGDTSTVEMTFTRPTQLGMDHAIFGDQGVTTDPSFSVVEDTDEPNAEKPSLVSNELWSCPSQGTVTGNVYALNGASIQAACVVDGDLHVKGKLNIGAKLEVTENLFLNGDLESTAATIIGKDALVRGKLTLKSTGHKFGRSLRVYETFETTNLQGSNFVEEDLFFVGTVEGAGPLGQLNATKSQFAGASWNDISEAERNALLTSESINWVLPSILDSPESPQSEDDKAKLKYPFITSDHKAFDGFAPADWSDLVAGKDITADVCSGEGYTKSNPVTINTSTFVDLTGECSLWEQRNLHIKLNADLVIYANSIEKGGSWSVTSGNSDGDDTRHTLYLISAPLEDQVSCSPGSGRTITFKETGWSQFDDNDPTKLNTKVVIYGGGDVKFDNNLSNPMLGQIYGCTVNTRVNLKFAKGGPDLSNTLWDLELGSGRDITS